MNGLKILNANSLVTAQIPPDVEEQFYQVDFPAAGRVKLVAKACDKREIGFQLMENIPGAYGQQDAGNNFLLSKSESIRFGDRINGKKSYLIKVFNNQSSSEQ